MQKAMQAWRQAARLAWLWKGMSERIRSGFDQGSISPWRTAISASSVWLATPSFCFTL